MPDNQKIAELVSGLDSAIERQSSALSRMQTALHNLRRSQDTLRRLDRDLEEDERKWANAYLRNGLEDIANLRSLVHDILNGRNDVWAKHQLLEGIAAIEVNLRGALR